MTKTIEVTIKINMEIEDDDDDMAMAIPAIRSKIKDFDIHNDMVMINFLKPDKNNSIINKLSRLDYLEQVAKVTKHLLTSDKTYVNIDDIEQTLKNKKGR